MGREYIQGTRHCETINYENDLTVTRAKDAVTLNPRDKNPWSKHIHYEDI